MFFGMNWIDITIVCILLFGLFDGMHKGFIVSFFNIAGIFISLYLSRFLMGPAVSFLIKNTSVYTTLNDTFTKRLPGIDSVTMNFLKLFNVKGAALNKSITIIFIDVACFILIFFISTIFINILKNFLRAGMKRSPFKQVDKLLGGIIGLTIAGIFIFIFFAVLIPLTTVVPKNNAIVAAIGTSKFAKYFFYYNFIIPWLQKAYPIKSVLTQLQLILISCFKI